MNQLKTEQKGVKTEMGLNNKAEEENCSMNEALLFATMCIIGLPVDVHLKDGSVYSGIFHTASVEKEYGVFYFLVLSFSGFLLSLVLLLATNSGF